MNSFDTGSAETAIIGMACRLPGAAHDLDGLAEVVLGALDATSDLPADRYAARTQDLPAPVRHGGFLADSPWLFDHAAFAISLKEATYTDPQHRLLLEVAYHALEDAGIDPSSLRGTRTGVFVGLSTQDYARRMAEGGEYNGFFARGSGGCMAAGRISYHLGLEGPSVVVDTACSSSLVAVHQARAALASGECDLAIVAGVTLLLSHDYGVDFDQAGMLAADGRCKPFTTRADGFARGEGVGAVVLTRPELARAQGRRVHACVLGSAVNSDGRSNGITAPSQKSQRRVITDAMADAGVRAEQVAYVETHGTGTDLGDRIELSALAEVFGGRETPLHLGALKANLAHTESAAGIANLIKAAFCVSRGFFPPHAFHTDVDNGLALDRFHGTIPGTPVAWPETDRRIGGVSSFGISGTNAHVIVGNPESRETRPSESTVDVPGHVLHLSARTAPALRALAVRYAEHLARTPAVDLGALGEAVLRQRQVWPHHRLSVTGRDAAELAAALRARAEDGVVPSPTRKVLFHLGGQGHELAAYPGLQAVFEDCAARVGALAGGDSPLLSRFLHDYALGTFWLSLGVRPHAVLGHGAGRYAAACLTGELDLETAVRELLADTPAETPDAAAVLQAALDAEAEIVLDLGATPESSARGKALADGRVRWLATVEEALAGLVEYRRLDPRAAHRALWGEEPVAHHVDLPHYPFDRALLVPPSWTAEPAPARPEVAPLLTSGTPGAGSQDLVVDAGSAAQAWVTQHRVGGQAVLPGTFSLTAALELSARWLSLGGTPTAPEALEISNLTLQRPVVFAEDTATRRLRFTFEAANASGRHTVRLLDADQPELPVCVDAQVGLAPAAQPSPGPVLADGTAWESSEPFYTQYARHGVEYGELFRRVTRFHRVGPTEIVARIEPPAATGLAVTHPAFLDSCLHTLGMCVGLPDRAYAPVSVSTVRIHDHRAWDQPLHSHVVLRAVTPQLSEGDLRVYTEQGTLVAELLGVTCRGIADSGFEQRPRVHHDLVWEPRTPAAPDALAGQTWLLADFDSPERQVGLFDELERGGAHAVPLELGTWYPDARPGFPVAWRAIPAVHTLVVGGLGSVSATGPEQVAETLASYLKTLHALVGFLEDRHPGALRQLCLLHEPSPAAGETSDMLAAGLAHAVALAFPTEFPRLRAGVLSGDTAVTGTAQAIAGMREHPAEPVPDGLRTPFWRYAAGELAQQCTRPVAGGATEAFQCHPDGVYAVTGAFGGIGRLVVESLVRDHGCTRLLLLTRAAEPTDAERIAWCDSLRARYGVHLGLVPCDLADPASVTAALSLVRTTLRGVFHLAGTTDDRSLGNTDAAQLRRVLAGKAWGAWALHQATRDFPRLDVFALFSSVAALVPSPGQLTYALANTCLAHLADRRAERGLPATVLHWGSWAGTGMMGEAAPRTRSAAMRALRQLDPAEATGLLFQALADNRPVAQAVFATNDSAATAPRPTAPRPAAAPERTASAPAAEEGLDAVLLALIATETGEAADGIDAEVSLEDLGVDSVSTIRIRGELQDRYQVSIPATLFLETKTVRAIRDELAAIIEPAAGTTPEPVADVCESVQRFDTAVQLPLSLNQFALWYEQLRVPDNHAYHCAVGWRIEGDDLHVDALRETWAGLLAEHELLRATFDGVDGEPSYYVHGVGSVPEVAEIHLETLPGAEDVQPRVQALLRAEMPLDRVPPTRVRLLRVPGEATYLVFLSHHVVMDAEAMFHVGVQLLRALVGEEVPAGTASTPYREFVQAQRAITPARLDAAVEHTLRSLVTEDGDLVRLELPTDRPRPTEPTPAGGSVAFVPSPEAAAALAAVPAGRRTALCLGTWLLLLARYTGQQRLVTGIALNGRSQQRWMDTVGHFVNVLPLGLTVDERAMTVDGLVASVREALLNCVEHQDVPLAVLARDQRLRSAQGQSELLQTYFNYFDASAMARAAGAAADQVSPLLIPQQEAQFDVSLWVTQLAGSFRFELKYRADLYDEDTIARMGAHYDRLLTGLADPAHNGSTLSGLPMLAPAELAPLAAGTGPLGGEVRPLPAPAKLTHEIFEEHVLATPDAIAVEWGTHTLTYAELDAAANTLAESLRGLGIGLEDRVGLLLPRFGSPETAIAMLAIWKCRAAYVALDLKHPAARTGYMLDTASCTAVVVRTGALSEQAREALAQRPELARVAVRLDPASRELAVRAPENPVPAKAPAVTEREKSGRLAYVLYTSGSTGNPKGVMVEHGGLVERLEWMREYFSFGPADKFLQGTVITFDISVPEFFLPLIAGGAMVLFAEDDNEHSHPAVCDRHGVTLMSTVPSLINVLVDRLVRCASLRDVISVGEILMAPVVNAWLASGTRARLQNLYGPTEATIYATYHHCDTPPAGTGALIGVACEGVLCWVLDPLGRPVPVGVPGELYLGGSGVARGYLGAAANPFADNPGQAEGERMYKTGDLVRWLADGTLEYIGRNDFRVKLRGQLIELGEIDHALMDVPGVRHATTLVLEDPSQGKQLLAAVIGDGLVEADLQAVLGQRLPVYMVPWRILSYEEFPLNSSGKVDRKALGARLLADVAASLEESARDSGTAPATGAERAVAELWSRLLGIPDIGVAQSFFRLGGNSLTLTKMVLEAERELGLGVDLGRFLQSPDIRGFLAATGQGTAPAATAPWRADLADLAPARAFPGTTVKPDGAYLLTGATGHLGTHLLKQLLTRTGAHVYAVVRAADDEQAGQRLAQRYAEVFAGTYDHRRVTALAADLGTPRFGLSPERYAELTGRVSRIVHSAAHVNHSADYQTMRTGNVTATRHVLAFAADAGVEHLHFVSTQYAGLPELTERWADERTLEGLEGGYEQTKYVAELLARHAAAAGYPVSAYRLPLLIDGTDTRSHEQNHFVMFALKCLAIRAYPEIPLETAIVPTEHAAEFLVARSTTVAPSAVRNPHLGRLSTEDVMVALSETSPMKSLPYEEWLARVKSETLETEPFFRVLPLYTGIGDLTGIRPVGSAGYDADVRLGDVEAITSTEALLDRVVDCLRRLAEPHQD